MLILSLTLFVEEVEIEMPQETFLRAGVLLIALSASPLFCQSQNTGVVRHVSARSPVIGPSREMAADRPARPGIVPQVDVVGPTANRWVRQAIIPGAVIKDISFPTPDVG